MNLQGSFEFQAAARRFRGRISASTVDIAEPVTFTWTVSRGTIVGESSATIVVEVPDDGGPAVTVTATAVDVEPADDIEGQRTFQLVKPGDLPVT